MKWEIERFCMERADLSPYTRRMYRHLLLDFARCHKGRKVSVMDVLEWFKEHHPTWSDSSKHNAVCALRAYFRLILGHRDHPVDKMKTRRTLPGPQRTLDEEEVEKVFHAIDPALAVGRLRKGIAMRNTAMFSMILDNGLRASEILRVTMPHLHLKDRYLCVRVKGGHWRNAIFSDGTAARMLPWLLHRALIVKPGVEEVFINEHSQKMTTTGFRANCYRIAEKAGIPSFSPHALRRTMATLALKRNMSVKVVKELGGWKDIEMVLRYSQTLVAENLRDFLPDWPVDTAILEL